MISKLLLFVHTVWAGSMTAKLTVLRFLSWKILFTGVTLGWCYLLEVRSIHSENLISNIELHFLVANIDLICLILNLIHHCSSWRLLIFIIVSLIVSGCVMRRFAHTLVLASSDITIFTLPWRMLIEAVSAIASLEGELYLVFRTCWSGWVIIKKIRELRNLTWAYRRCSLSMKLFVSTELG
jgi:hypothetical protein